MKDWINLIKLTSLKVKQNQRRINLGKEVLARFSSQQTQVSPLHAVEKARQELIASVESVLYDNQKLSAKHISNNDENIDEEKSAHSSNSEKLKKVSFVEQTVPERASSAPSTTRIKAQVKPPELFHNQSPSNPWSPNPNTNLPSGNSSPRRPIPAAVSFNINNAEVVEQKIKSSERDKSGGVPRAQSLAFTVDMNDDLSQVEANAKRRAQSASAASRRQASTPLSTGSNCSKYSNFQQVYSCQPTHCSLQLKLQPMLYTLF